MSHDNGGIPVNEANGSTEAHADKAEPRPFSATSSNRKVVLALGGGGARGFSHLGVMKKLADSGVPIDSIVGTSIGAVVGAVFALDPDPDRVIAKVQKHIASEKFRQSGLKNAISQPPEARFSIFATLTQNLRKQIAYQVILARKSLFKQERLVSALEDLVGDKTFADLAIPFAATAVDLVAGTEVLMTEGSLIEALVASCSLPGFFPPVRRDDMLLADLGVINAVPVFAARRLGADFVIAVDITSGSTALGLDAGLPTGFEGIMRMANIASTFMDRIALERADVVIRPALQKQAWSDFTGADDMIGRGEAATAPLLPQIERLLWWRRATSPSPPADEPVPGADAPDVTRNPASSV
jgi:NTE family protein